MIRSSPYSHLALNAALGSMAWRHFYDGQMPMEEDSTYKENSVSVRDYTQYGLGARGIDYIRNVHHYSGASVVFPIYDGHGNMVYTLSRGGNDTFSLGNKRIYDAWGDLRYDGNPNAGPNTQYCANLGHKLDNESGLTYMRARYYEPWTGRFVSQDPARDGWNWFVYARNNPIGRADATGKFPVALAISFVIGFVLGALSAYYSDGNWFLGGLAGGTACMLGTLAGNPLLAGAISGFLNSVMDDIVRNGFTGIDWAKALASLGIGAGTGGLAGLLANKLSTALLGKMTLITDYTIDTIEFWADELIASTSGLFGEGTFKLYQK